MVWLAIGAACGFLFKALYHHRRTMATHPVTPTNYGWTPVIVGMVIAAFWPSVGILYSLNAGAALVLRVSGAVPADPAQYAQLHNLVEALAIGEGIPKPAVYVIDDPSPNAFATGVSPDKAAITFTTGLLAIMNREELEGVDRPRDEPHQEPRHPPPARGGHHDRHGRPAGQHPVAERVLRRLAAGAVAGATSSCS